MDAKPTILERVFAAADALYVAQEGEALPTVDAVRKQAGVNMNEACTGMKAWRRLRRPLDKRPMCRQPCAGPPRYR